MESTFDNIIFELANYDKFMIEISYQSRNLGIGRTKGTEAKALK